MKKFLFLVVLSLIFTTQVHALFHADHADLEHDESGHSCIICKLCSQSPSILPDSSHGLFGNFGCFIQKVFMLEFVIHAALATKYFSRAPPASQLS